MIDTIKKFKELIIAVTVISAVTVMPVYNHVQKVESAVQLASHNEKAFLYHELESLKKELRWLKSELRKYPNDHGILKDIDEVVDMIDEKKREIQEKK